jgi:hypothetical protein
MVNQNHFSRVNNHRDVRVININRTTIINNCRAAPVVNLHSNQIPKGGTS